MRTGQRALRARLVRAGGALQSRDATGAMVVDAEYLEVVITRR